MHFHFFNAFEEDGSVVLDTIGCPGQVTFSTLFDEGEREKVGLPRVETPVPEVVRYRISPSSSASSATPVSSTRAEGPPFFFHPIRTHDVRRATRCSRAA